MKMRSTKTRAKRSALPKSNPAAGTAWPLHTAKARFSEVFRRALASGPQLITRDGRDAAVMLPVAQFDALVARSQQPKSLVEFFKRSPLAGLDLLLERDRDSGRDVEL
jgi:prevent-host-death family protein